MKAYLFDADTGLYEGETFIEDDMLIHEDNLTMFAPPDHGPGKVPVFDRKRQVWEVIPVTIARQLLDVKTDATTEKRS